jgi:Flp pilus assembly secretin CpaC
MDDKKSLIIGIVVGVALGWLGHFYWGERITSTVEKPVIVEKVVTQTDTKIQYVPKETIIYKDQATGQTSQKDLDGKFELGKTEFIYTVNGQSGKFTKADDEQYVFDKNMMSVKQSSTVTLRLDIPTVDKTKNHSIGIGTGSHGLALMYTQKNAWGYYDKDTKAGGFMWRF